MVKKKRAKKKYPDSYNGVILRIYDRDLDPEKITKMLRLLPSHSHKRGYEALGKSGKKAFRYYGQWNLNPLVRTNARIQTKVEKLWLQLEPRKKELRSVLKKYRAELAIYVNPGRPVTVRWYTFNSELLNKFTSLGIDVQFSVHNF
jgi:hypothetical protein